MLSEPSVSDTNYNNTSIHIQAWNIIFITLLQRAHNIQYIAHTLIYEHTTKYTLSIPPNSSKRHIPKPKGKTFSITILEGYQFILATPVKITHLDCPTPSGWYTHPRHALSTRLILILGTTQDNGPYCQRYYAFDM